MGEDFAVERLWSKELPDVRPTKACGELPWERVAAIIEEIDGKAIPNTKKRKFEEWLIEGVFPKFPFYSPPRVLTEAEVATISSCILRRMYKTSARYSPPEFVRDKMLFAMKPPSEVNVENLDYFYIRRPFPIGWIRATKKNGNFVVLNDNDETIVAAPNKEEYGKSWAVNMIPHSRPPFRFPEELQHMDRATIQWFVYSQGIKGWLPAFYDEGEWFQKVDNNHSIRHRIPDVPSGEYGQYYGALAGLFKKQHMFRGIDRLVIHPTYKMKWIGAFTEDGKWFIHSYPEPIEIGSEYMEDNFRGSAWVYVSDL